MKTETLTNAIDQQTALGGARDALRLKWLLTANESLSLDRTTELFLVVLCGEPFVTQPEVDQIVTWAKLPEGKTE